ncbi:MAG TPA: BTAD domain-containing putative transcriptional regulator [Candidatus Nanopelagicales bacterium]|nr:BTAD domain-containing putative transcriptional regulator [Candidatus Nanopelagicales bacterium]
MRIQVCGRLVVEVDGERRESRLPGRQGRLLLTYLVLHRHDRSGRDHLVQALWPEDPPNAADNAVYALISKLRAGIGPDLLSSRDSIRLTLPPDSWVDLEAARDGVHRAESALALQQWGRAWGAAQISLFVSRRGFLPDEDLDWATATRRELDVIYLRALETYATAALHLSHTELATAERAARELVAAAPYRESGDRTLMSALAAQGNTAEALMAYEALRRKLSDELGVEPDPKTRNLHQEILLAGARHPGT